MSVFFCNWTQIESLNLFNSIPMFDPQLWVQFLSSGHWTRQDTDTCPILDTCSQSNVSSGTCHWTEAGSHSCNY